MHHSPLIVHALVLRSAPAQKGMIIAPCFTETYGRISIALYKAAPNALTPFSLVEAHLKHINGDFAVAQQVHVLDTFAEIRELENGAKALILIRTIIEHCLPQHAPSKGAWEMITSILTCLPSLCDWKVAPFLLAAYFFEQEGVSKEDLLHAKISDEAKKKATQAFSGEKAEWLEIPEELLEAALELAGVQKL